VLIKDIIVETGVTYSEAGKLASVSIGISATFYSCHDESEVEQLFIEIASVSAEIAYQVADLGSDRRVFVDDQVFEVCVNLSVVDVLIEVF